MTWYDPAYKRVKKDWFVLEQAKGSVAMIAIAMLAVGGYAGFQVTNWVLHEQIEGLKIALNNERQKPKPTIVASKIVLIGYGHVAGTACSATVDLSRLTEFEGKYDVAVLCGVVDNTVDRMTDKRTSLSSIFVIRQEAVAATWPLSREMSAAQDELAAPLREQLLKMKLPESLGAVAVVNKWYEVVLIPRGVDKSSIHSLQDVLTHGGRMLSQEGWGAAASSRT